MTKTGFAVLLLIAVAALGLATGVADEQDKLDKSASDTDGRPLASLRVALVTGEGFQDAEAMMPLAYLTNRGAEVTVIGRRVGEVKAYNSSIRLMVHKAAGKVAAGDFDALVLPGGQAPARIREDQAVVDFVREMYASGKPVAAICHGPQVLVTAGVVEDRTMTCYADVAEELRAAGATYKDEAVVRDGHLVTSRLPKDIPEWLAAMESLFAEHRTHRK